MPHKDITDDEIDSILSGLTDEVAGFSGDATSPSHLPSPPATSSPDLPAALRPDEVQVLNQEDGRLAMELVADLRERKDIAATYGLTLGQLKIKEKDPLFKSMLTEAKKLWTADASLQDRVRAKAGFLVEDMLLYMYELSHRADTPAPVKHDIFKSFAGLAQVKEGPKEGDLSSKFSVTINIPAPAGSGSSEKVVIEGKTVENSDT